MAIHPSVAKAIGGFDAVVIDPGSFYISLMPILLVKGMADALRGIEGPVVFVSNLLTEGRGMRGFSAGEAVRRVSDAVGHPVDVAVVNDGHPEGDVLGRYASEHKELLSIGDMPEGCEVVSGSFWQGQIARHARRRLAYALCGAYWPTGCSAGREGCSSPPPSWRWSPAPLWRTLLRRARLSLPARDNRTGGFLDRGQQLFGRCAARVRPPGQPDVWYVVGEDIVEVSFAFHAQRCDVADVDRPGPEVAMFDQ